MPSIPPKSLAILREMAGGRVLVGVLGESPLKANKRTFRRDDGTLVSQYIVVYLLREGFVKVISDEGARRCYVITQLGLAAVAARVSQPPRTARASR